MTDRQTDERTGRDGRIYPRIDRQTDKDSRTDGGLGTDRWKEGHIGKLACRKFNIKMDGQTYRKKTDRRTKTDRETTYRQTDQ